MTDCCDVAWILAFGYMIIVPAIVVLTGIVIGYYFKGKLDAKNKKGSFEAIPPRERKPKIKPLPPKEEERSFPKKTTKKKKKRT